MALKFINEGGYAPEQYDVFDDIGIIAYVRYRYGCLWVEYPWVDGDEILYVDYYKKYQGSFTDESERLIELKKVEKVILEYDREMRNKTDYCLMRNKWNEVHKKFIVNQYGLDVYNKKYSFIN